MTLTIPVEAIRKDLNSDIQFCNWARLWNVQMLLKMGEQKYIVRIIDGKVQRFDDWRDQFEQYSIVLGGTVEDWDNILRPVPPPYYQDLVGMFFRHDFEISGDLESAFAYYGALNRMLEVMRMTVNSGKGES